ncbi:MAG: hypothetical protein AAGF12_09925 [Myxococcota bacterium]
MSAPAEGRGAPGPDDPDRPVAPVDLDACRTVTFGIYEGLHPSCGGCHARGTNFPAFASLQSFERLIAYNPAFVQPQNSAGSELVALLEGTGQGSLTQMPVGDRTFAELATAGETELLMTEVREWVDTMEVCEIPAPADGPIAQRVGPEQVRNALEQQLGLTQEDLGREDYLLASPDGYIDEEPPRNARDGAFQNWAALGGPHYKAGAGPNLEPSPLFLQTLGPLSQAWCRVSVDTKDVLFRHATRDSDSSTDEAAIKQNIEYLYLRMLGEVATAEMVDAMYDGIYRVYEAREDAPTAWTAVCATLIRDPAWITY